VTNGNHRGGQVTSGNNSKYPASQARRSIGVQDLPTDPVANSEMGDNSRINIDYVPDTQPKGFNPLLANKGRKGANPLVTMLVRSRIQDTLNVVDEGSQSTLEEIDKSNLEENSDGLSEGSIEGIQGQSQQGIEEGQEPKPKSRERQQEEESSKNLRRS
jgi:hypothetical protein